MAEPCIYGCKNDSGHVRLTNNHDRVCTACAMDIHMDGHPRHMTAEEFRNFKKGEEADMKTCDKCGTGAGPRAKACPKCGEAFKAKEKKEKQVKGEAKVKVGADKPAKQKTVGAKFIAPALMKEDRSLDDVMLQIKALSKKAVRAEISPIITKINEALVELEVALS